MSGARTLTAIRAFEPIEGSFRVDCAAERISSVFESIVERAPESGVPEAWSLQHYPLEINIS